MDNTNQTPEIELEPSLEQIEQEFGLKSYTPPAEPTPPTPPTLPPGLTNQPNNPWRYAGSTSSFPALNPPTSSTDLSDPSSQLSCKLFSTSSTSLTELPLSSSSEEGRPSGTQNLLIFNYRGKIHAIEHACPHQGYPMSKASVNDIEDFGVVLSAGVTCPMHGWTFDLFTGEADTGRYKLGIWEVHVEVTGEGVWVRRKERRRMG